MNKYRLPVVVVLYLSFVATALADDDNEREAVIVTATRTAQTVDETLASVTVITREDIERRQARSVEHKVSVLPIMGARVKTHPFLCVALNPIMFSYL